MGSRRWVAATLLASACGSDVVVLEMPVGLSDGDLLLLSIREHDEAPSLYAAQVAQGDLLLPTEFSRLAPITSELAVYSGRSLESLLLSPEGLVAKPMGLPLPIPTASYRLRSEGPPENVAWTPDEWGTFTLAGLRFDRSHAACLSRGECFSDTREGHDFCATCPARSPVEPPAAPVPPGANCPPGWRSTSFETSAGPVSMCDPRPVVRGSCPAGFAQRIRDEACTRVGRECPAGVFGEGPPNALHVDPRAASGGTGGVADPFNRIADALAMAAAGDVILLAVGTHAIDAPIALTDRGTPELLVTIRGACAERTIVDSATPSAFELFRSAVRFEDLTALPDPNWVNSDFSEVQLVGVSIRQTRQTGSAIMMTQHGRTIAQDVDVHSVDRVFVGEEGAELEVDHAFVNLSGTHGIEMTAAGALTVQDTVIVGGGTQPSILTDSTASVSMSQVSFEGAHWTGVHITGSASVRLESVAFNAAPRAQLRHLYAVAVHQSEATIRGLWVEGSLGLLHHTAQIDVFDAVIHPFPPINAIPSPAIYFYGESDATLERMVVAGAGGTALSFVESNAELRDIDVRDVPEHPVVDPTLDPTPYGIRFYGADQTVFATRVSVRNVRGIAVDVVGPLTTTQLSDFTLVDVGPTVCWTECGGFCLHHAGITLNRTSIENVRGIGVAIFNAAEVVARDLRLFEAHRVPGCRTEVELSGSGVMARARAFLDLERFDIQSTERAGLVFDGKTSPPVLESPRVMTRDGVVTDASPGVLYLIDEWLPARLERVKVVPRTGAEAVSFGLF